MQLTDSSRKVYINISIWLQQTTYQKEALGRMRNSEEEGTLDGSGKLREITPCFPRGLKCPYTLIKQAMEREEEKCPVEALFGSRSQYVVCVCACVRDIMVNFIRVEPKESLIVLMFRNLLDYYVRLQATTQTLRFFQ